MVFQTRQKYRKEIAAFLLIFQVFGGYAANRHWIFQSMVSGFEVPVANMGSVAKINSSSRLFRNDFDELASSNRQNEILKISSGEVKLQPVKLDFGGPSQPEMSSFKPVGADNMVDLFTGDFSYNIPLLDVGGYPVNLFYNSGITMDQEASWVGLGWNINPGTIMRNMRGVPDDFDGSDTIVKTQSIRPDRTWGFNLGISSELVGIDLKKLKLASSLGTSLIFNFNNQRGLGIDLSSSIAASLKKSLLSEKTGEITDTGSLKLNAAAKLNLSSQGGASVSPSVGLALKDKQTQYGLSSSIGYSSRMGLQSIHMSGELPLSKLIEKNAGAYAAAQFENIVNSSGLFNSNISFAYPSFTPTIRMPLSRKSYSLNNTLGGELFGWHPDLRIGGFYTESKIADEDKISRSPAYGAIYYQKANGKNDALLDFNRMQDAVFAKNSPTIGVPVYTYDVFSISGEGVGGCFRVTRNDLGFVRDKYVATKDFSGSVGLEFGIGNASHSGGNVGINLAPSYVSSWKDKNFATEVFAFKDRSADQPLFEEAYFRNPGEKVISNTVFQDAVGGEDLVRLKLEGKQKPILMPQFLRYNGVNYAGEYPINKDAVIKYKREKRTQNINYLTSREAELVGFEKWIYSYTPTSSTILFSGCAGYAQYVNKIKRNQEAGPIPLTKPIRKSHHLSEIDVMGQDGRRYVYGIPVYNLEQTDYSFSVNNGNRETQLCDYQPGLDDGVLNRNGVDWYVEKEEVPAYAHSFLLTALLSTNYVDLQGDGITDDDYGDAIKFNYSKFNQNYNWRTPVGLNKAAYSEGLKTDNRDEKGHVTFGQREMWYLYSIESKNLVARFYVKNNRLDARQVKDYRGEIDTSWGMQSLDKINLYSKADLIREENTGKPAKPIKTVHFEYDYSLCVNAPNSIRGAGKLTLKSVYFTYNGNQKGARNRYRFVYDSSKNFAYDYAANDRWGNYKPSKSLVNNVYRNNNPGGMDNADYPYAMQEKVMADKYAGAWTLSSIKLPSGSKIDFQFEADDYAFVQDRRATQFYPILGFGGSSQGLIKSELYEGNGSEHDYMFIRVPDTIFSNSEADQKKEIQEKYLSFKEGSNQIYLRLNVQMPSDKSGSGFENIPLYADFTDFGLRPNSQGTVIYIKLKRLDSQTTPMVQYSFQFLKNNLPGKAFSGSVNEDNGFRAIVTSMGAMFKSFRELFFNQNTLFKIDQKCRFIDNSKSLARLTNPVGVKYGGGLRVKRVVISDGWNKMTGQYEATYGKEYTYQRQEQIAGEVRSVSSGVASWEPSIGGDENPHKEIVRFLNRNKGGPYDYSAVELPIGEIFYPSASVGYSRVEVKSIHRDSVKNAVSRDVTEFFTTREFPFKSDYTSLLENGARVIRKANNALKALKLDGGQEATVSQGFRVDMNDMNGKLKSQFVYSAKDSNSVLSSTEHFYNVYRQSRNTFSFNHNFPSLSRFSNGVVANTVIGRDIELMSDFREHKSKFFSAEAQLNNENSFAGIFPLFMFSFLSPINYEENLYRSSATLKIVNHYGMLDSIRVVDKGSSVSTKNVLYDAETGNVLLTRTNNEFNKPVYNFTYPAYWSYPEMGPSCSNIDARFNHLTFRNGKLSIDSLKKVFVSGDELLVESMATHGPAAQAPCDPEDVAYLPNTYKNRIWVINTAKVRSANPHLLFIDENGSPFTGEDVTIRVIRSGARNLLDQNSGSITCLGNPIQKVSQELKLIIDSTSQVLQTSAVTYKDNWRVDDVRFRFDSVVPALHHAKVKRRDFEGLAATQITAASNDGQIILPTMEIDTAANSILARTVGMGNEIGWNTDSWVRFGFAQNNLPANSRVYSAKLSLWSHTCKNMDANYDCDQQPSDFEHPTFYGNLYHDRNSSHWKLWNQNHPENDLMIFGMKTPWPTDLNGWKQLYAGLGGRHRIAYPSYVSSTADNSEISYAFANGEDNRIDLNPAIVQGMVDDARWPLNHNSAGIRIMQARIAPVSIKAALNEQVAQCFVFKNGNKPKLSVYYYECEDNGSMHDSSNVIDREDTLIGKLVECYTYDTIASWCRSVFDQKTINPYVHGVLGNWRPDHSYVYYGNRMESDPAVFEGIDKSGTIEDYRPFWLFSADGNVRNEDAAGVWLWNSEITQYNRKGYEIENRDPLGRYNSGLYGYNLHLPVAVANNARVNEIMYDGFEDYNYQTYSCPSECNEPLRNFRITDINSHLDTIQQHTGKFSLRVSGNSELDFTIPVFNDSSFNGGYGLRVRMDSSVGAISNVRVLPLGKGLYGQYYNNVDCYGMPAYVEDSAERKSSFGYNWSFGSPKNNIINSDQFSGKWTGKLLAPATGQYRFWTIANNYLSVEINGSLFEFNHTNESLSFLDTFSIHLIAGTDYDITIKYADFADMAFCSLYWSYPRQGFQSIPAGYLFDIGDSALLRQAVLNDTTWCDKPDTLQISGHALNDSFSLIQGKKMLMSAWVKEIADCKCDTYLGSRISVSYNSQDENIIVAQPVGNIIEGWQRYEFSFDLPPDADSIHVRLINDSVGSAYFDDLRIHPFNSNMKTFVYQSSNLRLMAELDENNYATFYEYDDEGTLTRLKKETSKGVKTIKETRSAIQKNN